MINTTEIVKRLEKMIGADFNEDKIKVAFDSKHDILMLGEKHGIFTRYLVFEDVFDDSELIYIYVDSNNIIIKVEIKDYR